MPFRQILPFILAVVFLIATVTVAIFGFGAPKTVDKTITQASYSLQGSFTEQAYRYPEIPGEESAGIFFPNIINDARGSYIYNFSSAESFSDVNASVRISVILTRQGAWSKEIEVLREQNANGGLLTFPLDLFGFMTIAEQISEELGLSKSSNIILTLKAVTQTEATIDDVTIVDTFIQKSDMLLSPTILEWNQPLSASRKGIQSGVTFEHHGQFEYEFSLSPNYLYGATTLKSTPPVRSAMRPLPQRVRYLTGEIDLMKLNFKYRLYSEESITGVNHEAQVNAVLASNMGDQVTLPLVEKTQYDNNFSFEFPVDIELLYDLIRQIEGIDNNGFSNTYDFLVKVDVQTTATAPDAIKDTLSTVWPLTIDKSSVSIGRATNLSKDGSITKTEAVSNRTRSTLLYLALSLLFLTLVMGLWGAHVILERRKVKSPLKERWEATEKVADKHRSIFIFVAELPTQTDSERIVTIDNMGEMVKLADSLLKPVLHYQEGENHLYTVIDGSMRYIYSTIEAR